MGDKFGLFSKNTVTIIIVFKLIKHLDKFIFKTNSQAEQAKGKYSPCPLKETLIIYKQEQS